MNRSALTPVLLLLACAPAGPTWHADVAPLLNARCTNCHVVGGIAPFALTDYATAKPFAAAMLDAVKAKRMPPWQGESPDVKFLRDPTLSPEQVAMLEAWVKGGAVEGDPKATPAVVEPTGGGISRVDLELPMVEPYTPTGKPDDYRCFPIRWPQTTTTFVTGFNAIPEQAVQVHHIALYLVPPDAAALPVAWDAEEAGPGYSCFGGPFGSRPQQFAVQLINAWIPGYQGVSLERGMGIEVPPGALVVLQVHYNTAVQAKADRSKLQFTLERSVAQRAAYQPYLDVSWVAGQMRIPSGKVSTFQLASDPRDFFSLLGSPLDTTAGFNLEAVMFHMHKLGSRGELWLEKADKRRINVLTIPKWDFHWQLEYHLAQPLRFEPGDKLRVRCTFDNTSAATGLTLPPETNWGENSSEEMCVANILSTQ